MADTVFFTEVLDFDDVITHFENWKSTKKKVKISPLQRELFGRGHACA
jgi:hypothetical protein